MIEIATALDLPACSPGGSVELLHDLYAGPEPLIPARAFMLQGDRTPPSPVEVLRVEGKCLTGPSFWSYTNVLATQLTALLKASNIALTHLQHLTFGAT